MSKKQDRNVFPRDGQWVNQRQGASRASSVHDTQQAAIDTARDMLQNQGGGDLSVHGRNGVIRSKDTIGGNDPNPPKDTEH